MARWMTVLVDATQVRARLTGHEHIAVEPFNADVRAAADRAEVVRFLSQRLAALA